MAPAAENNATLKEETFTIERAGRKTPVFAVGPDGATAFPALIVVHEIFGVNAHIKNVARRFASQNLRVFAPDLFAPAPGFPADADKRSDLNVMRDVWGSIDDSQLISDMHAVFDAVAAYPGVIGQNIGALGYCMGGAMAFMFACSEPKLAWIADYYGRIRYGATTKTKPKHPIEYAHSLRCPMLGLFAGNDELITRAHVDELSMTLEKCSKSYKIKIYENADHAFFNDERAHYDKDAAEDAWQLTLDFIKLNTKGERSGPM